MRKWMLALRWGLVVVWMSIIFAMSATPVEKSWELSGSIAEKIPVSDLGDEGDQRQEGELPFKDKLNILVRKGAHVAEYFILCGLLLWALIGTIKKDKVALYSAVVVSIAYAGIDELHQLIVPGRTGNIIDVLIDSLGVLALVIAYKLLMVIKARYFRVT